jgi:hypothetical protein
MRTTLIIMIIFAAIGIQSAYAGGPRMDWDERYEDIPGAPECWVDGFDDGLENPIDQERNEECRDKGDQYYRGWLAGCVDAGNTRETCEKFTDK